MREPGFETLCAHAGEDPKRFTGAAVPPIYQNSLFTSPDSDAFHHRAELYPEIYDYTRTANPTTDVLEAKLAALEGTQAARCFGSGMAAIAAAVMHLVGADEHIVAVDTIYGPARALLGSYMERYRISVTYVPGTDPQQFADALRPNTRLIYLETPSTFVFRLQDLAAVCSLARERGTATIADNSWASPYFQNPADFGVDVVVHSATKYLGGHSDIVAGVAVGPQERIDSIKRREGSLLGAVLDPFAAWLMLRGLRTLPLRMERHQANALAVARFLEQHRKIARVYYPGLPSHPQYDLVRRQMRGTSGLMSMELKDGGRAAAFRFVDALRYFGIAVSWGGFESLAVPAGFAGGDGGSGGPGRAAQGAGGIAWGARLHIGLETVDDLIEDLDASLSAL